MSNDDGSLIRRTLAGETAAYGELVSRHQDRLFNVVFRQIGHAEDARDVVQDAFISAYEALGRFNGEAQFFTWLYRIAVNAAISHKRKQGHRQRVQVGGRAVPDRPDLSDAAQPDAAINRQEAIERVQRALLQVTPEYRAALVLREIDGRKYEEIAEILELPIGTVRSRIFRGRLELRANLESMTAADSGEAR